MKSKANKLIIGIIFLAGLSLLLYPFVANQWNNYRQKQLISSYEQTVSERDAAHEIDYDAELQKAEVFPVWVKDVAVMLLPELSLIVIEVLVISIVHLTSLFAYPAGAFVSWRV